MTDPDGKLGGKEKDYPQKPSRGGQNFNEEKLPFENTAECFKYASLLEIDFAFFRPLPESKESPAPDPLVLKKCRQGLRSGHSIQDDRLAKANKFPGRSGS